MSAIAFWRCANKRHRQEPRIVQPYLGDCVPPELMQMKSSPSRRSGDLIARIPGIIKSTLLWTLGFIAIAVAAGVACVLALLISPHARSHEAPSGWSYPIQCCGGHDCAPVDSSRITELSAGGFMVDGLFYIARDSVQWSLDGRYHACVVNNAVRCFFAPPKGM